MRWSCKDRKWRGGFLYGVFISYFSPFLISCKSEIVDMKGTGRAGLLRCRLVMTYLVTGTIGDIRTDKDLSYGQRYQWMGLLQSGHDIMSGNC
jgi:hypothetical protein